MRRPFESSGSHQRRHPLQVRGVQGVLIHRNTGVQQAQQLLVHVHQGCLMDLRTTKMGSENHGFTAQTELIVELYLQMVNPMFLTWDKSHISPYGS